MTWSIPIYNDDAEVNLNSVEVNMNPSLGAFVTYNSSKRELTFDRDEQSAQLSGQYFTIEYNLENLDGEWATFSQPVIVLPSLLEVEDTTVVDDCTLSFEQTSSTATDY